MHVPRDLLGQRADLLLSRAPLFRQYAFVLLSGGLLALHQGLVCAVRFLGLILQPLPADVSTGFEQDEGRSEAERREPTTAVIDE